MDIFVRLLDDNKLIKGIRIDNSDIFIKSLHYADDSTHFFSSPEEYVPFKECLELFSKGSNFKVSYEKSELIIVNSNDNHFGDSKLSKHPVRYLGAYFNRNGLINNFQDLMNKFQQILTKIKATFPNFLSRVDCFKSYIQGVLYFHGSFAEFKQEEIKKLENLERWFLFSNDPTFNKNRKYSNIKLARLAQDKYSGGENLRLCWDILCNSKSIFGIPCLINKSKNLVLSQLFHNLAMKKMRTHSWKSLLHPITFHVSELNNISLIHSSHSFINQIIHSTMHFSKNIKYSPPKKKRCR